MKTTVEVPDDLGPPARAALRARKLKDLVGEGLWLVLAWRATRRDPSLAGLMKGARGMLDSGIPDIASNSEHLAGLGRDANRR
jgi:hypothetical protein